jgi:membrane fusion protein
MSLFRKEAISHQNGRLVGAIVLTQPMSLKLTVISILLIASSIIVFLFTAEYSRKETVRGFLMPNKGVIKSLVNQSGTIEKVWVKEGDKVTKGQVLVSLRVQQNNHEGIAVSQQLIAQLNRQSLLFDDELKQHHSLQKQQVLNLKQNIESLIKEQAALEEQFLLAQQKFTLLQNQQGDFRKLNNNGYLSELEKDNQLQSLLSVQLEQKNITRLLLQQRKELNLAEYNLARAPQQYALQVNTINRQKVEVDRQISQLTSNYEYTVTASHNGTVTGVQVVEGQAVQTSKLLMFILPAGSELVAELLLPTRSVGFVQSGQFARLRFDAFPYQRFGFIQSQITRIDKALISPNEAQLPVQLNEPMYRLRAKLEHQQFVAYGKQIDLISGMLFEADIMLEQRTLIEWLFEPVYSLKGRIS